MSDTVVVCRSNGWGGACMHPVGDHVGEGKTPNTDCCCCTGRHNDPAHVDTCLDCSIMHGKRQVRIRGISQTATTAQVEQFIPVPLRRAFWERYVDEYLDRALGES